ncbi:MAG: ferritin-like domain-containing protein [Actinomycetota bacterium]|nr:ferritin-like domain-containing protein [Actinomycetota bacterium]
MRTANSAIDDLVEINREREAHPVEAEPSAVVRDHAGARSVARGGGALAAMGAAGAAFIGLWASAASAQDSVNVQALQTSASLENLAVATYGKALTLPYIASGNAVVKKFAQTTMEQHAQHAMAFNAAAQKLGGKPQNNPNPHFAPVVAAMVPKLAAADATTGPPMVVALALSLEQAASSTYAKNCQLMSDLPSRTVMSSILGIDCQHLAVLLAVQALLKGGAPQLIAIPTNAAALPAAAGSVGFPDTFFSTDPAFARPPQEGAVA